MENHKWTAEKLQAARHRMDPLADNFVAELAATKTERELFGIMQFLLNEFVWLDDERMDEATAAYITEASKLPSWVNQELIKKGEKFFAIHGFEISIILMMKALPSTYCCWRGAEVVYASGRLTEHSGNLKPFTRRLMQTSKFVLNAMSEDGLMEEGLGVKASVKVRTLHAFVRHFLKANNWDTEKYGEPINQQDYAGTMLSFSVFVIDGLKQIGVKITPEEREAYYHIWRIAAYIIGVEEEFLPEDYEEGEALGHMILNDQKGDSEAGKALTQACVNFCEKMMPYRFMKFIPENMMYQFMGPEFSEIVGIKKSRNWLVRISFAAFKGTVHLYEWLKDNVGFVQRLAIRMNPKLLNIIIVKFLKETRFPFTPATLQATRKDHTRKNG